MKNYLNIAAFTFVVTFSTSLITAADPVDIVYDTDIAADLREPVDVVYETRNASGVDIVYR